MNRSFLYIAAAALLTAACTEKVIPVTGVTLNPPDALLLVGATITLDATVEPDDATNKTVTWSADDDRVATVSAAGELTAVAPGTATITVTTSDGKFAATCAVNVEEVFIPVIYITLNQTSAALFAGETLTLEAAFAPANATNKTVTWSTSDDRIATINAAGEITAVAPGEATITATADNCDFPATCTVTVTDGYIPVTGITLNPASAILFVGATLTLDAAVEPAEATNKTVTWSTSDDQVVTINAAGELTAVALGTATITATTDDGKFTATCAVTVIEPAPGVITMTTQASEVFFYLEITKVTDNNVIIDWGDGEGSETFMSSCEYSYCYINVFHRYSSASSHNITITGNISHLECRGNQLTELDVSRNNSIRTLYCSGNPLTTLDVSRNTSIRFLHCCGNLLTTLDVSRNTALTHLYCSINQLTTLDVSNNTAIRFLYCEDNQFTASAFNELFRTLPEKPVVKTKQGPYPDLPFTILIYRNPGTWDCDVSIAQKKGWRVHPTFDDL